MKIKFEVDQNGISTFNEWLKKFDKLTEELILEIDFKSSSFIAKTFTEDKGCIKYAAIDFNSCNCTLSKDSESLKDLPTINRVCIGLFRNIGKFTKILDYYSNSFTMDITFDGVEINKDIFYQVGEIEFKNKSSKMKFVASNLSLFTYLPDNVFKDVICKLNNPVSIEVSEDNLKNIVSLAQIDSDGESKSIDNMIGFKIGNNDDGNISFIAHGKNNEFAYPIEIKDTAINEEQHYSISISKQKFLSMIKGSIGNFNISMGSDEDRIIFDSVNEINTIVIAKLKI